MDIANLYKLRKYELYKLAILKDITGRSNMNKNDMIQALYEKEHKAKKILEWNFDFNEDYDNEDEEIYESFKLFCENNEEITKNVEYAFVCSGYADRVVTNNERFLEFKNQKDGVVIFPDYYWNNNLRAYFSDQTAYKLCLNLPIQYLKRGGIVYKLPDKPDGTEISYVDLVGDLEFCCFCRAREASAIWYQIEDEILLMFEVDTESG